MPVYEIRDDEPPYAVCGRVQVRREVWPGDRIRFPLLGTVSEYQEVDSQVSTVPIGLTLTLECTVLEVPGESPWLGFKRGAVPIEDLRRLPGFIEEVDHGY